MRTWKWLVVALPALAALAALWWPAHVLSYVYTWDSAAYVDCARSILEGRGFMQRSIQGLGTNLWEPISWWPPGYPLLMAAAAWVGVGLPQAGVVVAAISAAAAVMLLSVLLVRLFDWVIALPMVLTVVVTPAFLQMSVICMSDATYYAMALGSVTLLFLASERKLAFTGVLVAAGALAGLSWGVRNVALALMAASTAFLVLHAFWLDRRTVGRGVLTWGMSALLGMSPFAARNLWTFGKLNPYQMPPSDLSWKANVSTAADVVVQDLTGSEAFGWLLDNGLHVAVGGLLFLLVCAFWIGAIRRSSLPEWMRRHRVLIFCVVLATLHLGLVVAARTKYRWGEPIVSRHTMQTYWLIWIVLGLGLASALRKLGTKPGLTRGIVFGMFAAAALVQARESFVHLRAMQPGRQVSIERQFGPAAAYLEANVGRDQIVLAHYADLLRTHCNVNSRKIPPVEQYERYGLEKLTRERLTEMGESGFLWGIVVSDFAGTERGAYDELIRQMVREPAGYPEFQQVPLGGPAMVLKYVGLDAGRVGRLTVSEPSRMSGQASN